ncbi:hypothetical protein E1A91_D02G134600v1 [Gossypium mustelinum]|uniref:RRM domain-containing protein n=1 Tax=Gossypium mustelinum TaxID=34275 RepID=A0A5D2VVA0_GOSMU|nr:hypothetical protein E1A91_D02G134600v1 [Gossypium mustelinum]
MTFLHIVSSFPLFLILHFSILQIEPIPSGNLPPGFDPSTYRSVYVGNIHSQVTEPLLQEVFASTGPVEGCKLIRKEKVLFSRFSLFLFSLYEAVRVHYNKYFIWSFNSLPLEGTFF